MSPDPSSQPDSPRVKIDLVDPTRRLLLQAGLVLAQADKTHDKDAYGTLHKLAGCFDQTGGLVEPRGFKNTKKAAEDLQCVLGSLDASVRSREPDDEGKLRPKTYPISNTKLKNELSEMADVDIIREILSELEYQCFAAQVPISAVAKASERKIKNPKNDGRVR